METTSKKHTRAEQSRINGAKSKGAKTAAGQEKAQNGNFKHGAYAKNHETVLTSENQEDYDQLLAANHKDYDPGTALEAEIVQDITDATWQIRRLKTAVARRLKSVLDLDGRADTLEYGLIDQAVLLLERRIRQSRSERSKLILDLQRLKKLTPIVESSRAARNPEAYARILEVKWVNTLKPEPEPPPPPPQPTPLPPPQPS